MKSLVYKGILIGNDDKGYFILKYQNGTLEKMYFISLKEVQNYIDDKLASPDECFI